jgi:hypothetical protein
MKRFNRLIVIERPMAGFARLLAAGHFYVRPQKMHALIVVGILSLHGASIALSASLPEVIGPVVAGTVYLPLWPLASLGAPVLASAPAGGWASPSLTGWLVLLLFWAILWSALVRAAAKLWRRSPRHDSEA